MVPRAAVTIYRCNLALSCSAALYNCQFNDVAVRYISASWPSSPGLGLSNHVCTIRYRRCADAVHNSADITFAHRPSAAHIHTVIIARTHTTFARLTATEALVSENACSARTLTRGTAPRGLSARCQNHRKPFLFEWLPPPCLRAKPSIAACAKGAPRLSFLY